MFKKIVLLLVLAMPFSSIAQPYDTSESLAEGIFLDSVEYAQQKINYAYAGDEDAPGVLFVHGTPGNWQAFSAYLSSEELRSQFFLVSVDRLGWGLSQLSSETRGQGIDKKTEKLRAKELIKPYYFSEQAGAIGAIMQRYPNKKWIVVGHSLGASIAPKLALIKPESVKGMVLLAGSHKPSLGSPRWYNLVASMMLMRWVLPQDLRNSNDEIMTLKKELKMLETELSGAKLDTEVILIQGMQDRLVSPKNTNYIEQAWINTFASLKIIEIPEAGHFLPWEYFSLITKTINEFEF